MFARVISTNYLVGHRYLCVEATAPGIFLRKSGFFAGMFLCFRAHARARYQSRIFYFFNVYVLETQMKHLVSMWSSTYNAKHTEVVNKKIKKSIYMIHTAACDAAHVAPLC